MSKKILVIEDEEKFIEDVLDQLGYEVVHSIQALCSKYKLKGDVIEFKAVAIEKFGGKLIMCHKDTYTFMELPKDKFKHGDDVQVFAIKKAEDK